MTNAPRRVRRDQALAGTVLVASAVEVVARPDLERRAAAIGVGCLLGVAVLVRRTHGLSAVGLALGAFVVVDSIAVVLGAQPVALHSGVGWSQESGSASRR